MNRANKQCMCLDNSHPHNTSKRCMCNHLPVANKDFIEERERVEREGGREGKKEGERE